MDSTAWDQTFDGGEIPFPRVSLVRTVSLVRLGFTRAQRVQRVSRRFEDQKEVPVSLAFRLDVELFCEG